MAIEYSSTEREISVQGVKVLVYGSPGIGKTVLCSTAPVPIIISAEAGLLSLAGRNLQKIYPTAPISVDIPVIKVKTVQDLMDAHAFVAGAQAAHFKSVCIDSITEIAETILSNAKATVKDPRQAYGALLEDMMRAVKAFRDLPGKNVYMAAKMEPVKDELTGIVTYSPAMPGQKLGPQLPYLFDEVFRLGVNKDQSGNQYRFLQTGPDLQYTAKDRSGMLDPIEFPHLGNIFNKINGVQ